MRSAGGYEAHLSSFRDQPQRGGGNVLQGRSQAGLDEAASCSRDHQ